MALPLSALPGCRRVTMYYMSHASWVVTVCRVFPGSSQAWKDFFVQKILCQDSKIRISYSIFEVFYQVLGFFSKLLGLVVSLRATSLKFSSPQGSQIPGPLYKIPKFQHLYLSFRASPNCIDPPKVPGPIFKFHESPQQFLGAHIMSWGSSRR